MLFFPSFVVVAFFLFVFKAVLEILIQKSISSEPEFGLTLTPCNASITSSSTHLLQEKKIESMYLKTPIVEAPHE